jgi:hypothetical protein
MSRQSNIHAKASPRAAAMYRNVSLVLALLTFIVLLAGAPAQAAAYAPFAGKAMQTAGAPGADRLSNGNVRAEDRRVTRAHRNTYGSAPRATSHRFFGTRLVLAPRRMASTSARLGGTGTQVLVSVSWSGATVPAADSNPFALVGNRSGLVSATQAEVRDGQVWLTDRGDVELGESGGSSRRAAP